ncbi:MAG TPA: SOS response-associated peptidase [Planctomycetaceae bacterium]|jgi:putative SOS response-associated peptidase YedK|nr:SOS response-associated peptidase [Planctomycetaceae bacterium]
MCGRFTLRTPARDLVEIFELLREPELTPRYNIAPTQQIATVRQAGTHRELSMMLWGLIPLWADTPEVDYSTINARGETVAKKPTFRQSFAKRRCLVVADGFYEWQKTNGRKQPFFIHMKDDRPFAFAGLWDCWKRGNQAIESCSIIVTEANELVRPIHDRMPVIMAHEDYARWLDPKNQDVQALQGLLRPYPAEEMTAYPISTLVNSPRNESPECVVRLSA